MSENGTDYTRDQKYTYQDGNEDKNHNRQSDPKDNLSDPQPGMIVSDSDDEKLHHRRADSQAWDEILQATASHDVIPIFSGVILGPYSGAVSDPPTDAELDAIFTSPAALGDGCIVVLFDGGSGGQAWLIVSDGVSYWHQKLTVAV